MDYQKRFEINETVFVNSDDNITFIAAQYLDNVSGFEVYTGSHRVHIGAIHYSKLSKKYSYHTDTGKFIYYSANMLSSIANMVKTSNDSCET